MKHEALIQENGAIRTVQIQNAKFKEILNFNLFLSETSCSINELSCVLDKSIFVNCHLCWCFHLTVFLLIVSEAITERTAVVS